MIEFRRVNMIYDEAVQTHALHDISLTIEDGEFVFIIGDSGAGKSTMLRLLLGEERPTSGMIVVDGVNVGKLKNKKLPYYRRHFGMIFQDFRLLQDYSVYENVAFAQRVVSASPKGMKRRVPKILTELGLGEKLKVCLPSFPAGSSSGSHWHGLSSTGRSICSRMSRPGTWTRPTPKT